MIIMSKGVVSGGERGGCCIRRRKLDLAASSCFEKKAGKDVLDFSCFEKTEFRINGIILALAYDEEECMLA